MVEESSPLEPRGNPAPKDRNTASSSHELPMESRAKVEPGSGKHSVYTHFLKDPKCDICLKTKITKRIILVIQLLRTTKFSVKLEILRKIQTDLQEQNIEPEKFEDRIIFMSMFNDIELIRR